MEEIRTKVVAASDAKYQAEQALIAADAKIKAACDARQIPTQEDLDGCSAAYRVLSEATYALNQALHAQYQAQRLADDPEQVKKDEVELQAFYAECEIEERRRRAQEDQ